MNLTTAMALAAALQAAEDDDSLALTEKRRFLGAAYVLATGSNPFVTQPDTNYWQALDDFRSSVAIRMEQGR